MDENKAADAAKNMERTHPYEKANCVSKAFFCWLLPVFYKGFRADLTEEHLYPPLDSHESKRLGDKLEAVWLKAMEENKSPSLWKVLWKIFWKEFCMLGMALVVIEILVRMAQPLALSELLHFYEPNSTMSLNQAYFFAGVIVICSLANVMSIHFYMLCMQHLGLKIRVAVCSLIYRKALRLSKTALASTTIGQMVNLLSNDVSRFNDAIVHLHNVWLAPLETILILVLLYIYVGITSICGAVFLLLFIPLQMWMAKMTSVYRLRTALKTDERIRQMNEIISGIQVIKMYTWEKPFAKLVEMSRRNEIQQIKKTSIIRALTKSFNLVLNRVAIYLCILTYVFTGNIPNSQYVYVVTSFYGILRKSVTMNFPQGITQFAEISISVKRILEFLMFDELDEKSNVLDMYDNPSLITNGKKRNNLHGDLKQSVIIDGDESIRIKLENVSAKWVETFEEPSIMDVNMQAKSDQLVAVIGAVGSGKSTLLHVILGELPPSIGAAKVNGRISYASQEPWLFSGSIRQNILFGQNFDKKKYDEVVRVCALERDFQLFPYGDQTIAAERGATLSGGQRARINLARAVYKDADIYLLDDPLSAVDVHVGKYLFDECITRYLKNKCVVLVTHQLQHLRNVEKIYYLENGKVLASGTYDEIRKSDVEFMALLDKENNNAVEESDSKDKKPKENDTISDKSGEPVENKEGKASGKITWDVYKSYVLSGGHWCTILCLMVIFVIAQLFGSITDYFLTLWVNAEQIKNAQKLESHNVTANSSSKSIAEESLKIFSFYISEETCIMIYSALLGLAIIFTVYRSVSFFKLCMKASIKLHNSMFNKIVYATMRFFNTNPSGRILNRFSKDMGSIDEILPVALIDTIQNALQVLAISGVVCFINPWMLIPTVVILSIFYMLRIVFLASSRDIKRLEGTTRSPVFSHLSASLQGLTTIRAFRAESTLRDEFDNYQNVNSSAFFMFLAANRCFGLWLDLHCVLYIALITLSFLFIKTETFGGNIGLAITQALSLTGMFQWGMRQWSELENQMTSVERVKEYSDITPELDGGLRDPPNGWPENGNIFFENVSLRYAPEEPYVLKNLTFRIKSTEKIGIIGRTGAGKSSLISALFRLANIDGQVFIDNVDTKSIPLEAMRSKLSIIPQEPVLFSGTLRKNLDPFDKYNDEVLWNALEEVELRSAVQDMPHGLDSKVSEGGSNFSVGQRQLVCLARAIIRKNKVLVLDEATANVDPQTDALIQGTIRGKFAQCTVLTIAHRLHTIMDSDKVLVMDAGRAVEFDHPYNLLQDEKSVFYGLVQQTGIAMAENLYAIAEESYKLRERHTQDDTGKV